MFPNQFNQGTYPQMSGYNSPRNYPMTPSLSAVGQPQPAPQPLPLTKPLIGRVVGSPDEILMNDVPQDNTIALFPMEDYSCILAKQWSKNGSGIDTIRYVPDLETQPQADDSGVTLTQIMDKMNNIESMINQLTQRQPKNYHNKQKNYQNNRNSKQENQETEEN